MGVLPRDRTERRRAARDLLATGTWTVRGVAEVLGVHRDTVYEWMRDCAADADDARRDAADLAAALDPET